MTAATPSPALSAQALMAHGRKAFLRASEAGGRRDVDVLLATRALRMSFAGAGMCDVFMRALAGERLSNSAQPLLRIHAWDAATTGVSLPPNCLGDLEPGPLGVLEELCDARFRARLDVNASALVVIDLDEGEALYYVPDAALLPYWELAHPARHLFAAWAGRMGLQMCHAGGVGDDSGGALLAGPGGSGKSTTALACMRAGLRCVGDDYVLVETDGAPVAHSLYSSALLHHEHLGANPALMPHQSTMATTGDHFPAKAIMFAGGGAISASLPLTAIVLPSVADVDRPKLRPTSPGHALRALAPSSMLQLGSSDPDTIAALARLCRSLPCFELTLGGDVQDIPDIVRTVLTQAR